MGSHQSTPIEKCMLQSLHSWPQVTRSSLTNLRHRYYRPPFSNFLLNRETAQAIRANPCPLHKHLVRCWRVCIITSKDQVNFSSNSTSADSSASKFSAQLLFHPLLIPFFFSFSKSLPKISYPPKKILVLSKVYPKFYSLFTV